MLGNHIQYFLLGSFANSLNWDSMCMLEPPFLSRKVGMTQAHAWLRPSSPGGSPQPLLKGGGGWIG